MSKQPKISIVIIHYNTPHYLETCLEAIFAQTYKNLEVIFLDNNSPDKSGLEFVRKRYGRKKNLQIIANKDNLGYALAANQGIRMAIEGLKAEQAIKNYHGRTQPKPVKGWQPADYVVITNPDIIYTQQYFEKIVPRIEKDPQIAAITGKVLKYDFEKKKRTKIVDTVGLFAYRNRRVIDEGQGIEDKGQFNDEREVFGVSGACPLYRREALEDAKVLGEYLDEDFFMYKEDVDLSWRFQILGWKCLYYPKAIAYHGRGTGVIQRFSSKQILNNRAKLSRFQRHYSFKNQGLMELKNETWPTFIKDFFPILSRKILMPFYVTFREPFLWKAYWARWRQIPSILRKRRELMKKYQQRKPDLSKWFQRQSSYFKAK